MRGKVIVVFVSETSLCMLLGNWRRHTHLSLPLLTVARDKDGNRFEIPTDVEIVRVNHQWDRRGFGLMLQHDSFASVPDAEYPPEYTLTEVCIHGVPVNRVEVDGSLIVDAAALHAE